MTDREFEELYREYFAPVFRYSMSLTRDIHAAEELTQETFFKAMQAAGSFRGECRIQTWLFRIAKNRFLSDMRRQQPCSLEELSETAADTDSPESAVLQKDESMRLHRALLALAEPYKEVFSLRVFGQLSFRQIGELFGKTENWACVTFHRAKMKMIASEEEDKT